MSAAPPTAQPLPERVLADHLFITRRPRRRITSGRVGLNYTGGSKVMAVHAYRAVEDNLNRGVRGPIYSYLDPRKLMMRFDRSAEMPEGHAPQFVDLHDKVALTIRELFSLHSQIAKDAWSRGYCPMT